MIGPINSPDQLGGETHTLDPLTKYDMAAVDDLTNRLNRKGEALSIRADNRRSTVAQTQNIIARLIQQMTLEDDLFRTIYNETNYTGSYYERLKIHRADEFDLNLKLKLPFDNRQFQVVHRDFPPGFAKYKLSCKTRAIVEDTVYQNILTESSKHLCLSRVKINSWMQSVVDRALDHGHFPQIEKNSHGAPATTLTIKLNDGNKVSVDLVPVIQLEHIPRSARRGVLLLPQQDRRSCLVPKPPPSYLEEFDKDDVLFRVSLPEIEKSRTQRPGCFKPTIRLFKDIRDQHNLEGAFPSYFIKTFMLWQWEKRPRDKFWAQDNSPKVYVKMLEEFVGVLNGGELPHYFFPKFNLLGDLGDNRLKAMVDAYSTTLVDTKRPLKLNRKNRSKMGT